MITSEEITTEHRQAIRKLGLSDGTSKVPVHASLRIPGAGKSLRTSALRTGIQLGMLGQRKGRTGSGFRDTRFGSLILLAAGKMSDVRHDKSLVTQWHQDLRDVFDTKRVTGRTGELFTYLTKTDYRLPVERAREHDVLLFELWTWFREVR